MQLEEVRDRHAALNALRAATTISEALKARLLLAGNPSIVCKKLADDDLKAQVPDFLALDTIGPFILGKERRVFAGI